jgi:3-hydroxybutyryl-CoA dehydrogenase
MTAVAGPVAVVGAGTMGAGIAQVCATAGADVLLYSRTGARLVAAGEEIDASLNRLARRASQSGEILDAEGVRRRISAVTDLDALAPAAVVVESISEDPEAKRELFARLGGICSAQTLWGSNTSGLSITRIAAAAAHPERVVGMHFCAPVPVMRVCEVMRGEQTTDATMADALAFVESIGKRAVPVNQDSPGYITTRLMAVLVLEAIRMVEEGTCRAEDVDLACRLGLGQRMGPLASADLSGLDVLLDVVTNLHTASGRTAFAPPALLEKLVAAGHDGRKSGRGFHNYPDAR